MACLGVVQGLALRAPRAAHCQLTATSNRPFFGALLREREPGVHIRIEWPAHLRMVTGMMIDRIRQERGPMRKALPSPTSFCAAVTRFVTFSSRAPGILGREA